MEGTTRKETSQEEFRARVGPFKKSLPAQRFHGDSLPPPPLPSPPPRAEVTTDQTDGVRDARDTGSHAEEREDDAGDVGMRREDRKEKATRTGGGGGGEKGAKRGRQLLVPIGEFAACRATAAVTIKFGTRQKGSRARARDFSRTSRRCSNVPTERNGERRKTRWMTIGPES